MPRAYAAIDLGASSGRVALGLVDEGVLSVEVVHRFANRPLRVHGRLVWDIETLFAETIVGLRAAVSRSRALDVPLSGIGVDSWGVDYALVDGSGYSPVDHYRASGDPAGVIQDRPLSESAVFSLSGVPDHSINTSLRLFNDPARADAERLLFVADLWIHRLTGVIGTEPTIASTSQLLDIRSDSWSPELAEAYDIPSHLLPPVQKTGSLAGHTTPTISERIGSIVDVPVYVVAEHDTASAFAFARAAEHAEVSAGLISSGTWSIVGIPLSNPMLAGAALTGGFTNERGVESYLLLRNLSGMWLLQEGLREWTAGGASVPPLGELVRLAENQRPQLGAIDVADRRLLNPVSMLHTIADLCLEAGGEIPDSPASLMRTVCDGLSRAYATSLEKLTELTGVGVDIVRIVGGGSQNRLLCQATADVTGLPVEAGPVEASSVGNIACQLRASGETSSIAEAYRWLSEDDIRPYQPQGASNDRHR